MRFTKLISVVFWLFVITLGLAVTPAAADQETPPPPSRAIPVRPFHEPPPAPMGGSQGESLQAQPMIPDSVSAGEYAFLVFQIWVNNNWEIFRCFNQCPTPVRLTYSSSADFSPQITRDGSRVVFVSDRDGNDEIYTMTSHGLYQTRLTNSGSQEIHPAWSPDGTRIAYASDINGAYDIFVMNADGSNPVRISPEGTNDEVFPAWSPDGTRIAWTRYGPGGGTLSVMNVDGSSPYAVTGPIPYMQGSAWSPDGTRFAVSADYSLDGWFDLLLVNADGSGVTQLENSKPQYDRDVLVGSWANNGREIYYSVLMYQLIGTDYYLYHTYIHSYTLSLNNNRLLFTPELEYMSPHWQTNDFQRPTAQLGDLPELSRSTGFTMPYFITNPGTAPYLKTSLSYNKNNTYWSEFDIDSFLVTNQWASFPLNYLHSGQDYQWRINTTDAVYNESGWSNIVETTLFSYLLEGSMVDTRGNPLTGATLSLFPQTIRPAVSTSDGKYKAYLGPELGWSLQNPPNGYEPEEDYIHPKADAIFDPPLLANPSLISDGAFKLGTAYSPWSGDWRVWPDLEGLHAQSASFGGYCPLAEFCQGEGDLIDDRLTTSSFFAAVFDKQGSLHVIFNEYSVGMVYKKRTSSGWSLPETVPWGSAVWGLDLGIDDEGNVYAAATNSTGTSFNIRQAATGAWLPAPEMLPAGSRMDLEVEPSGKCHILVTNGGAANSIYRVRPPGGSWSDPVSLTGRGSDPRLKAGPDGTVHLLLEDNTRRIVYYVLQPNGIWKPAESLSFFYQIFDVFLDVDSSGVVHVSGDGYYARRAPGETSWSGGRQALGSYQSGMLVLANGTVALYNNNNKVVVKRPGEDWSTPNYFIEHAQLLESPANGVNMLTIGDPYNPGLFLHPPLPPAADEEFPFSTQLAVDPLMHKPTLSFWYRLDSYDEWSGTHLDVRISGPQGTEEVLAGLNARTWDQAWVDMEPWLGKEVDISLVLHQQTGEPRVTAIVDAISLGAWLFPIPQWIEPAVVTSDWTGAAVTLHGLNFIEGATVTVDQIPAENVIFVDENTLQFILPTGLLPGSHTVWVTNPGGQKAALPNGLRLGEGTFLPVVIRGG